MDVEPSENAKASRARLAAAIKKQRLRIGWTGVLGGVLLVVSTVLVWVNHPAIVRSTIKPYPYLVIETSHSIGLVTWSAGPITLVLAVAFLWTTRGLLRGVQWAGWVALLLGLGQLAVSVTEIVQLLLGRSHYFDQATVLTPPYPPLANAVGSGVWLCASASVLVVAVALTYLWRARRFW